MSSVTRDNVVKNLKLFGGIAVGLGLIGLSGSVIVPARLMSQTQLVQRMIPYNAETATLTGDVGTPVGEPQQMIITEEAAFLPGKSEFGANLVNDNYLKEKGIYPLQVKTVNFIAGPVRLGAGIAIVVRIGILLWVNGPLRRKVVGG